MGMRKARALKQNRFKKLTRSLEGIQHFEEVIYVATAHVDASATVKGDGIVAVK